MVTALAVHRSKCVKALIEAGLVRRAAILKLI